MGITASTLTALSKPAEVTATLVLSTCTNNCLLWCRISKIRFPSNRSPSVNQVKPWFSEKIKTASTFSN